MNYRRIFLFILSISFILITIAHIVYPQKAFLFFFGVEADYHCNPLIDRALRGVYLGFGLFWMIGVYVEKVRRAALFSLVVFMFGLAAGRVWNVAFDGITDRCLFVYLLIEIMIGGTGALLLVLKKPR